MRVRVTKTFRGAADGRSLRDYEPGDEIELEDKADRTVFTGFVRGLLEAGKVEPLDAEAKALAPAAARKGKPE